MNSDQKNNQFTKPAPGLIRTPVISRGKRLMLEGPLLPSQLAEYTFSDELACFRQPSRQKEALAALAGEPDGIVFAALLDNTIVSYVTFHKPDYPWWKKRCFEELLELGAIETAPSWRGKGLARKLLDSIFNNRDFTYFENYIVIAVHTVDNWDLHNTGFSPHAYRSFMIDFFAKYNFLPVDTIDPEIREHPCNLLLARIGSKAAKQCCALFKICCLGDPHNHCGK